MYARQINGIWTEAVGDIVYSPTVYQTAESLSDEQRAEFGLYLVVDAPRPALTPSQKYGDPTYTIVGTTVERSYPVVAKTPEELAAELAARRAAMIVTPFQAKAALAQIGKLADVEALMSDPGTPILARLAWQEAIEFRRTSPTLLMLAAQFGLTDADLDNLFEVAATIEA